MNLHLSAGVLQEAVAALSLTYDQFALSDYAGRGNLSGRARFPAHAASGTLAVIHVGRLMPNFHFEIPNKSFYLVYLA